MRVLSTALAAAVTLLAACDGSSPTQPKPVVTSSVTTGYSMDISDAAGSVPQEVEVRYDGALVHRGGLVVYPWDYGGAPTHVAGELGAPAAGRHTIELRVTQQSSSPTHYLVRARVELVLKENGLAVGSRALASWDQSVRLATGESWRGDFEIDAAAETWDY